MALETGAVIANKYRIDRLLGEGGMGSVYLAVHTDLEKEFAVKTLNPGGDSSEGVERFKREARAAGRIGNDHILEVFDIGQTPNGEHYMVMEFLRGEPLTKRLERLGPLPESSFLHIALQLLEGLGAAHRAGIVHRDLKPDNIFLLENKAGIGDFVKIIDFGVSRFRGLDGNSGSLTKTGIVMGTPYYLSPEQAGGKKDLDTRSDLHTVGTILYECLAGHVPFQGAQDLQELIIAIMVNEPPHLLEVAPEVDSDLADIIMKAMAKQRENRFQTTEEFSEVLQGWAASRGFDCGRQSLAGPRASLPSYPVVSQQGAGQPVPKGTVLGTSPSSPASQPVAVDPSAVAPSAVAPSLAGSQPVVADPLLTGSSSLAGGSPPLTGSPSLAGGSPPLTGSQPVAAGTMEVSQSILTRSAATQPASALQPAPTPQTHQPHQPGVVTQPTGGASSDRHQSFAGGTQLFEGNPSYDAASAAQQPGDLNDGSTQGVFHQSSTLVSQQPPRKRAGSIVLMGALLLFLGVGAAAVLGVLLMLQRTPDSSNEDVAAAETTEAPEAPEAPAEETREPTAPESPPPNSGSAAPDPSGSSELNPADPPEIQPDPTSRSRAAPPEDQKRRPKPGEPGWRPY